MANSQESHRSSKNRTQGQRNVNRKANIIAEETAPRYDEIVYEFYSVNGIKPRTSAREVVRCLASDLVVELFIQDRVRTQAKTPEGRPYGIMAWRDKQKYAAVRFVAEMCYGPLENVHPDTLKWHWMNRLSDVSVLTDFQIEGIRSVFLLTVASEMQPGKSLAAIKDEKAIKPYVMVEEPDWYCEGLDDALERLESKASGSLVAAFKRWVHEVRGPALKLVKYEFRSQRETEVDAQVNAKEANKAAESTAEESESEIADALVKELTPLLIEAANTPPAD